MAMKFHNRSFLFVRSRRSLLYLFRTIQFNCCLFRIQKSHVFLVSGMMGNVPGIQNPNVSYCLLTNIRVAFIVTGNINQPGGKFPRSFG